MTPAEANMQSKSGVMETAYQQMAYSKPSTVAQIQAKEADVQALAELTRALDKKVAKLILVFASYDPCMKIIQMKASALFLSLCMLVSLSAYASNVDLNNIHSPA